MKYIININFILLFVIIIVLQACKDKITDSNIDIPSENVSYSQHIQPIFNQKCTTSGCHNDSERAGGLSLTTYANTVSDPSIVFPGEPNLSKLIWAIDGNSGAEPMPPLGATVAPMNENEVEGVKTWIKEGAQAN